MTEAVAAYRGRLVKTSNGEDDDLLGLVPEGESDAVILAEQIMDDCPAGHNFWSVTYYVSDIPVAVSDLDAAVLATICGHGDVDYGMRFSETTGYLWTDEELNVGGHNLRAELESFIGKFVHLEIKFSSEAKAS